MKAKSTQKHDTWVKHIAQWQSSGKTQVAYCQTHGLKLHQFAYWRSKLKADQAPAREASNAAAAFVPVSIDLQSPSGLVLYLPNGYRIEGITPTSMRMVPQLLGLLE